MTMTTTINTIIMDRVMDSSALLIGTFVAGIRITLLESGIFQTRLECQSCPMLNFSTETEATIAQLILIVFTPLFCIQLGFSVA